MKRHYFSGVVLPERALLSISDIRVHAVNSNGESMVNAVLNVYNNQLSICVDSDEPDVYTLRNFAKAEAEFFVNVAGFLMGYGYDVEVTKVFDQEFGFTRVFGIDIPVLEARGRGRDVNAAVAAIVPLCAGEVGVFLRRCLADLSFAIKRLDDTAFYCFRAIESLRQSFGYELGLDGDAAQWQAMATAIGGSKSDMDPIRKKAFPSRHGMPVPITDEERGEILLLTWSIVERYIDHRLSQSGAAFRMQTTVNSAAEQGGSA